MKIQYKTILVAACLSASAAVGAQQAAADKDSPVKNPHLGPYTQNIANVANWEVPPKYLSLDQDDTTRLMEAMQNPNVTDSWLFGPQSLEPWFAVVSYDSTGHVMDGEKLDADAILKQLQEGTEASNEERRKRGWQELHLVGWQTPPHYEADTKRLSWATISESGGQRVVNYTTKVLSRTGVASVTLVTEPARLDGAVADLKAQLNQFQFKPGEKYSEFKEGDKVAEYGLTGLIVGGAAAAAVKSGAWKWFVGILAAGWKVIAGLALAAFAGLKSLLSRKKTQ